MVSVNNFARESKSSMRYWHPGSLYDVAFFRPRCQQPPIRVGRDQEVGEKVREMEEDNIGTKGGRKSSVHVLEVHTTLEGVRWCVWLGSGID